MKNIEKMVTRTRNFFTGSNVLKRSGNYVKGAIIGTFLGATLLAAGCAEDDKKPRDSISDSSISIISEPITTVNEGEVYSYQLTAADGNGDNLTCTLTSDHEWLFVETPGENDDYTCRITGDALLVD